MFRSLKNIFKSYFVAGLLVLGPLVISGYVIKIIIEWADGTLQTTRWFPFPIPGLGVIIAIAIILFAGFLGRNLIGKYIFASAGELLTKIPVIGGIYSSVRQLFESLFSDHQKSFGRVVLVPYPHSATWTLAFVTSETVPAGVQSLVPERLLSVYVPTTPNPTSGFYIYVPHSQAKATNFTVEEAFKIIVSLGLVSPGSALSPGP